MSDMKDGGPAFPSKINTNYEINFFPGMTLRDWFAGQAIAGLLACGYAHDENTSAFTAAASYQIADAMLKAREVKP
jgi:hypothetical protein